MGDPALDHDRDTGAPDRVTARDQGRPAAALQSALERLRLEGAVFLRAEYREPWAYESLTAQETAKILRPDSDRIILFHVEIWPEDLRRLLRGQRLVRPWLA